MNGTNLSTDIEDFPSFLTGLSDVGEPFDEVTLADYATKHGLDSNMLERIFGPNAVLVVEFARMLQSVTRSDLNGLGNARSKIKPPSAEVLEACAWGADIEPPNIDEAVSDFSMAAGGELTEQIVNASEFALEAAQRVDPVADPSEMTSYEMTRAEMDGWVARSVCEVAAALVVVHLVNETGPVYPEQFLLAVGPAVEGAVMPRKPAEYETGDYGN